MRRRRIRSAFLPLACAVLIELSCAAPGPWMFPPAPIETRQSEDGGTERRFDTNRDGRADYAERLGAGGRIASIAFDPAGDDSFSDAVDLVAAGAGNADIRHLLIILDSIPYQMVHDLWLQGRFRHFAPPACVISPFPVMTDPALADFFGELPCPAVEAAYYDGRRLVSGPGAYLRESNAAWTRRLDYHLPHDKHGWAYLSPGTWTRHDLGEIQRMFFRQGEGDFAGYVVSTSGIGSRDGRNGHQRALILLDRMCQEIVRRTRGRVQITLMSDHGHNLVPSRRIPLPLLLSRCGYRVGETLKSENDLVIPEWGLVTSAAIYAKSPAVAQDAVGFEGVELAAYREGDEVVVLSKNGRARIEKRGERYRYLQVIDDPLRLAGILASLRAQGRVDAQGFVEDGDLFGATATHDFPDGVHRLWRAFDGFFVHPPRVLLSLEEGYYVGSPDIEKWLRLAAAHGNLRGPGSCGFAMTTAGELPARLRMAELAPGLRRLGVSVPRAEREK